MPFIDINSYIYIYIYIYIYTHTIHELKSLVHMLIIISNRGKVVEEAQTELIDPRIRITKTSWNWTDTHFAKLWIIDIMSIQHVSSCCFFFLIPFTPNALPQPPLLYSLSIVVHLIIVSHSSSPCAAADFEHHPPVFFHSHWDWLGFKARAVPTLKLHEWTLGRHIPLLTHLNKRLACLKSKKDFKRFSFFFINSEIDGYFSYRIKKS